MRFVFRDDRCGAVSLGAQLACRAERPVEPAKAIERTVSEVIFDFRV